MSKDKLQPEKPGDPGIKSTPDVISGAAGPDQGRATAVAGRGLSIGNKLLGIVVMLIALLATVAGIGGYQMSQIGDELVEIAEHDVPMTEAITQITIHQLEQAIALERAFRFGEEMRTDSHAEQRFEESNKEFEKYADLADAEFKETEHFIENAIKTVHDERDLKEFEHVLEALTEIDESHEAFEEHARKALVMLRERANLAEVLELEESVEAEETELDHNLEALLTELEKFTEQSAKNAEEHEKQGFLYMLAAAVAAAVVGFGLAFFLARNGISRPLSEVMNAMEALSRGDRAATLAVRSNDEVGKIAATFLVFRERLAENERMRDEQEAARADQVRRGETLDNLFTGFDKDVTGVLDGVGSAATELEQTAQSMSSTAEQATGQASVVATASNQATSNVQTVATAAEELSASIAEIGRQVNQSAKIAQNAAEEADNTNETVQGLAEAASKIGEVVNLINDIAGQTNLLALNATIEAARAGEAGKGFAVVAQEVKNLANQTAKATEEISSQIGAVQEETTGAVDAIQKIRTIIGEVNDIATTISSAVEEQGVSTQEIARNVQQAAQGTSEVNANIAGVTDAANQTGTAATQVLASSGEPSRQAEQLRPGRHVPQQGARSIGPDRAALVFTGAARLRRGSITIPVRHLR